MFSAVRNDKYIVLSITTGHLIEALKQIGKCDINTDEFNRLITPKNIDVISFVNDLALKNKIASKYIISTDIDTYHPNDYIWHQSRYNNGVCNVIIKDTFDEILMGDAHDGIAEDCPGTRKIADTYISAYDTTQKKILNQNSMYIRSGGGLYSIIERNLGEWITYLSWVKLNDAMKMLKSKSPDTNVDLASSFEIIQKTDGTVFDIVRKLKESKDTSFYMLDGKTGTRIKMSVDGNIPTLESNVSEKYYYEEMLNNLAAHRAGTVGALTTAIKSADDRIRRSMSVGVKTGLQLSTLLQKQGWEIKTVSGMECFVYPKRVNVTTVVGSDRKRYPVPEDCKEIMYLYDITVPIEASLYGLSNGNLGVKARGFHPHRGSGSDSAYSDLSHVKDLNRVCIGDLDGKPIEKIVDLIDTLSGAYQPSMMGNMASRCVSCLFGSDIAVMSTDQKTADIKKTMEYVEPIIKNRGAFKTTVKPIKDTSKESKMVTPSRPKAGSVFSVS